jgi:hypothetical protein
MVLLEKPGVPGIPQELEGVPMRPVVTGKFYALKPPTNRPPKPPRALTATAVSGENRINLGWTDRANNEKGFEIESKTTDSFSQIATVGANVTSYSDTGLDSSTTYTYRVRAYNDSYNSDYSNEASATTEGGPVDEDPPAAPTGLSATAVSSSQINLNWADNGESDLDHYNVYRSMTSGGPYALIDDNVTSSDYSDTGLAASTTYYYVVTAVDTSANESVKSNEASDTTESPPDKPPRWYERPVPIGISTGHPDITAGTIGCRVKDASGNVYALSNNHVYAASNNASIGDNVLQPGTYDGGVDPDDAIGTLADFEPIKFDGSDNTIDAAIASSTTSLLGNATPAGGYGTPSSTIVGAVLGQQVQKFGRTTQLTQGVITGVNVTLSVGYGPGKTAKLVKQIIVEDWTRFIGGGDSGSLLVTNDTDCNPAGLLFAGNESGIMAVANRIDLVLERFGVTVDGEGTTSPSPPTPEGSVSVDSITYSTIRGGRHLLITVALVDDLGGPVAGASVSILLIHIDTLQMWIGTETTGTDGTAAFRLSNAPSGWYTTAVTDVSAAGLTWDGDTPPNEFEKK